ncbi:hypothetical protein GOP47_0006519 [Adiantum capillus-veneris]|uniref:RRM domain-containing protein n=1 Tax=Adiantum capillus-veneris TaxID=13818 RepID=A0A9D4ZKD1_ADICA|nr:hypothetical protein GOP47_0006519 [Adiantum capillus-veneris]
MRRRSPSYSPPRRGYGGRGRSPPRGRFGGHRDAPCGLLVRNISKGSRPEDLRIPFERFGRVRDVYLPRDYYTGEPRGFGFVQYLDPLDAAEARRYMDRQILGGREITVVFAEENRKRPEEMRVKERGRGRMGYGGGRRSPYRGYSPQRSPRYRSPSPRDGRYSRSYDGPSRRDRYESMSPPPRGRSRISRSPEPYRKERDHSPAGEPVGSPVKDGHLNSDGHRKRGRRSASAEKSYSPQSREPSPPTKQQSKFRSPVRDRSPGRDRSPARDRSPDRDRDSRSLSRSPSPRSPPPRRQRHASPSMSPHSPPPRRQRQAPSNSRDVPDPAQKTYSSLTPEERSPRGGSLSPGPSS